MEFRWKPSFFVRNFFLGDRKFGTLTFVEKSSFSRIFSSTRREKRFSFFFRRKFLLLFEKFFERFSSRIFRSKFFRLNATLKKRRKVLIEIEKSSDGIFTKEKRKKSRRRRKTIFWNVENFRFAATFRFRSAEFCVDGRVRAAFFSSFCVEPKKLRSEFASKIDRIEEDSRRTSNRRAERKILFWKEKRRSNSFLSEVRSKSKGEENSLTFRFLARLVENVKNEFDNQRRTLARETVRRFHHHRNHLVVELRQEERRELFTVRTSHVRSLNREKTQRQQKSTEDLRTFSRSTVTRSPSFRWFAWINISTYGVKALLKLLAKESANRVGSKEFSLLVADWMKNRSVQRIRNNGELFPA